MDKNQGTYLQMEIDQLVLKYDNIRDTRDH